MATIKGISKTRKPKTNNFVLILDQFLKKYNLSAKSTPEQLSENLMLYFLIGRLVRVLKKPLQDVNLVKSR
jgi:hypothetical protein